MAAIHDPEVAMAGPPLHVVADTVGEDAIVAVSPEHGSFATFTVAGGTPPQAVLPFSPRRKVAYLYTVGAVYTQTVLFGSAQQVQSKVAGAQLPVAGLKLEIDSQEQYFVGPSDGNPANVSTIVVSDFWFDEARIRKAVRGLYATEGAI